MGACPEQAGQARGSGAALRSDDVALREAPDAAPALVIELWRFRLDPRPDEVDRLDRLLDGEERRRAASFVRAADRRRFVMAHGRLRQILGRYVGEPPAAVRLVADARGKPSLGKGPGTLEFNLAHAGELALVGVSAATSLGVDLEPVRQLDDLAGLARRVLGAAELALLQRLPAAKRSRAFLTFWTRKEAVLKACGLGLAVEPATLSVGLRRRRLRGPGPGSWHLRTVPVASGYVAAVAARHDFRCIVRSADALSDPPVPV